MKINYTNDASESLLALVKFIEKHNTKGAGLRWLNKYEKYLKDNLKHASLLKFCHNQTFRQLKLKCLHYNDWIIAFSHSKNSIVIEALLHKSRIKD